MINVNEKPNEIGTLAGIIDPDAYTAAAYETGYVSLVDYAAIAAYVLAGDLGSSATIDAKLRQATDASGTSVKDVTGKAITQLTQAGTDSNKQAVINCRGDELDVANGFTHVKLVVTVGTATSDMAAFILGFGGRFQPVADLTSVDEVVGS